MIEQTRWARLEPRTRDKSLAPGLEARVHDPLWLLGRQWQFGEWNADGDLGSAIVANVTAQVAPLARYRPGAAGANAGAGAASQPFDVEAAPLEALVEAEDVRTAPSVRERVRAGQHFERLLAAHGTSRYIAAYRTAYPLPEAAAAVNPAQSGPNAPALDAASRRFLRVVAGRSIDGARLYADLVLTLRPRTGAPKLPARPAIAAADVDAVRAAATDWLAWADGLISSPSSAAAAAADTAWVGDRMEYAFGLEAAGQNGAAVKLEAEEYADGELDWYTFSGGRAAAPSPPATGGGVTTLGPLTVIPTAVTYPGMPASRLWEFEDARVDFGGIQAEPEDLGRMLLAEFALVYGADWLMLPLEVPAGSLVRIVSLDVRDTFGRTVRVTPTSIQEPAIGGWRMFGVSPALAAAGSSSGSPAAESAPPDTLLVAPALASRLQGRAIEDVLLLRDEMANLVWAVERHVEGPHGLPIDRAAAAYASAPAATTTAPSSSSDTLTYRLRTDVPPHWLPFLPQRLQSGDPSMTLRLGALPHVDADGTTTAIQPQGRLLARPSGTAGVLLREEEVPRSGARVSRAYQLSRWIDGSTFLWLGRRKTTGRGEGSSGLRFDVVDV
jgi:hypothetical protein